MKFIEGMKLLLSLLPQIIAAIKAIEEALPGQGAGEQKLAMVRTVLEQGYSLGTDATTKFETIWPAIQGTINGLVNLFNSVGVFKKS